MIVKIYYQILFPLKISFALQAFYYQQEYNAKLFNFRTVIDGLEFEEGQLVFHKMEAVEYLAPEYIQSGRYLSQILMSKGFKYIWQLNMLLFSI